MNKLPWSSSHAARNVSVVKVAVDKQPFTQYFLLSSDRHHDNPQCRQDLERKHLDQVVERRAGIIDCGDLFCAMQGKYDPRKSIDGVREENRKKAYLDSLVTCAADFYGPYAQHFVVVGRGNHEQSILDRNGVDLTNQLVGVLNDRHDAGIQCGGYGGWVRFQFNLRDRKSESRRLWYYHGTGGGGPITKDMIAVSRYKMRLSNADVLVTGHTHDSWVQEEMVEYLNIHNVIEQRQMWCVKCPTYKDEWRDGYGGWHVERGGGPKPLGAYWLKFSISNDTITTNVEKADG